jgi:hypothetical protein
METKVFSLKSIAPDNTDSGKPEKGCGVKE